VFWVLFLFMVAFDVCLACSLRDFYVFLGVFGRGLLVWWRVSIIAYKCFGKFEGLILVSCCRFTVLSLIYDS